MRFRAAQPDLMGAVKASPTKKTRRSGSVSLGIRVSSYVVFPERSIRYRTRSAPRIGLDLIMRWLWGRAWRRRRG